MNFWEPYNPAIYFLHTVLGTVGVLSAIIALGALKGKTLHIRMGWVFIVMVAVAATTAIIFSFTRPSPLSVASALITYGLVLGAILALRERSGWVKFGESIAFALLALPFIALFLMALLPVVVELGIIPLPPPPPGAPDIPPPTTSDTLFAIGFTGLYALIVLCFLIGDLRFFRLGVKERDAKRFRRHLSRMTFALAIAIHAPIVTFGDRLGLDPFLAFFGPFLLYPIVMYFFRNHRLLNQDPAFVF